MCCCRWFLEQKSRASESERVAFSDAIKDWASWLDAGRWPASGQWSVSRLIHTTDPQYKSMISQWSVVSLTALLHNWPSVQVDDQPVVSGQSHGSFTQMTLSTGRWSASGQWSVSRLFYTNDPHSRLLRWRPSRLRRNSRYCRRPEIFSWLHTKSKCLYHDGVNQRIRGFFSALE